LTFTLTSSANISGRSRLYSTLHQREKNHFNFDEPPTREERASSAGSKSTSLDLFPNIAAISSTDEIELPLNDEEVGGGSGSGSGHEDETKTPTSQKEGNSGGGGLSLFGGVTAMLAMRHLSNKKQTKDKDKEEHFSDIRNSITESPMTSSGNGHIGSAAAPAPTSTTSAPEKKSFLQRAFGFISSETSNPQTNSDPEEEDLESGIPSKGGRSSLGYSSSETSSSPPTQPPPPTQPRNVPPPPPSRNIVQPPQRNIVQPPQRNSTQPPPPPPKNSTTDPSPPRPHTKVQSPKAPQASSAAASASITEDMKRRHSISTSRALAQEALRVAQARKASLNERVSLSKNSLPSSNEQKMSSGLAYENIYPAEPILSSNEEVVVETNNQILGLNRHRESEIQRRSFISQSSTLSAGESVTGGGAEGDAREALAMSMTTGRDRHDGDDDDSEGEEHDQFSSHTNPMISSSITLPKNKTISSKPSTNPAPPPTATNLRNSGNREIPQSGGVESFEPDNSARALEKRRRSTRFPSIKGKREMFLLRSNTGSSVGSNAGDSNADLSAVIPPSSSSAASASAASASTSSSTGNTKRTNESYRSTGEGSGLSGISNTSPVTVESALSRRISRKFVGVAMNEEFTDKVTQFYSYNDLKRAPLLRASSSVSSTGEADPTNSAAPAAAVATTEVEFPPGVNPKFREQYLSDLEFETIFNMSKSAFNAQPKWKKQELKKRHNLF
jgi:hypothetical protein